MKSEMTRDRREAKDSQGQADESIHVALATYNVVSDTVVGVNFRWRDNLFQAVFVMMSVLVAALCGAIAVSMNSQMGIPWYGGALAGVLVGLLFGLLTSGVILMVYRGVRHLAGKHA